MKTISKRLCKLELRRIEQTPNVIPGDANRRLLEKINAIRERLDAARAAGEYLPTPDPERVKAILRERFAHLRKKESAREGH